MPSKAENIIKWCFSIFFFLVAVFFLGMSELSRSIYEGQINEFLNTGYMDSDAGISIVFTAPLCIISDIIAFLFKPKNIYVIIFALLILSLILYVCHLDSILEDLAVGG